MVRQLAKHEAVRLNLAAGSTVGTLRAAAAAAAAGLSCTSVCSPAVHRSQVSFPALTMEEATRKASATWMPEMSDIRLAHVAQADALETVVSALASKQQASIAALRREVKAIAEWQSEAEARSKANGEQGIASYSGGYDPQAVVAREQALMKGGQDAADVAGRNDGTTQSRAKGKQRVSGARREYDEQPIEARSSARGEQGIAGAADTGGYSNQPADDEHGQARGDRGSAAGGDYPIIDEHNHQVRGSQGTADATGDSYRPTDALMQARGVEQGITDTEGGHNQQTFDAKGQASGQHRGTYTPVDDMHQPTDDGQSQPNGERDNFQPIDEQRQPRGEGGIAGGVAGGDYQPLEGEVQTRGEQGSYQPIDGQSQNSGEQGFTEIARGYNQPIDGQGQARGERGGYSEPVGGNYQPIDGHGQGQTRGERSSYQPVDGGQNQGKREQGASDFTRKTNQPMRGENDSYNQPIDGQGRAQTRGDRSNYQPIDGGQSQEQREQGTADVTGTNTQPMRGEQDSYNEPIDGQGQPRREQGNYRPIDGQSQATTGEYSQRIGEQSQAREDQGVAAGYYKTMDGQVRMRGDHGNLGVAKGYFVQRLFDSLYHDGMIRIQRQ